MAGLFDDKSGLRPPPMMGKKSRSKLNKHNYYRMPPNMKGATAAAKGGLGGAISSGRKMQKRNFFDGGHVLTGGLSIDSLMGDPSDDTLDDAVGGIASKTPTAQDIIANPELGDKVFNSTMARLQAPRMEALRAAEIARQQKEQEVLRNMRPIEQGKGNLPMMAMFAAMGQPSGGGSFLGAGPEAYVKAETDQRKQQQEFQKLQASLGLDAANRGYDNLYKQSALEQDSENSLRTAQARIDAANIYATSRKKVAEAKEKDAGKALPANLVGKLSEKASTAELMDGIKGAFKDGYGGSYSDTLGEISNWVGSRGLGGEDNIDKSEWWKNYDGYANQVRNQLFGSALTKTEEVAWKKANITPGMDDDQIKKNLARQDEIVKKGLKRYLGSYKNAGYNVDELSDYLLKGSKQNPEQEGEPLAIKSDEDYHALPSGATFIDPNGKKRIKP